MYTCTYIHVCMNIGCSVTASFHPGARSAILGPHLSPFSVYICMYTYSCVCVCAYSYRYMYT